MKGDPILQKIFKDSEKAELLEKISEQLKNARRMVVVFETPSDKEGCSEFQYYQLGFTMTYEVLGMLDWTKDLIISSQDNDEEFK
jgi:hypothetical protein